MSPAPRTDIEPTGLSDCGELKQGNDARLAERGARSLSSSRSTLPPANESTPPGSLGPTSARRPKPSVLIVEDSPVMLRTYAGALTRRGYDVSAASSVEEGRAAIAARRPDIVLLDIFLPRVSGLDLLVELRAAPPTAMLPVILVSGLSDKDHIVDGLARGANDYVTKPIVMPVLVARIESLLRTSALIRQLELQADLLAKLAAFDELTGVYSRRALFHALDTELTRSQRYRHPLSVLMIDVDHFKAINDRLGHAAGDAALRELARRFLESLRGMDVVGRYGGEEFCVVLPETNLIGALRAGERVRQMVASTPFDVLGAQCHVSVSIGVSTHLPQPGAKPPDLLAEADAALLEAKRDGRNRVVAHKRPRVLP